MERGGFTGWNASTRLLLFAFGFLQSLLGLSHQGFEFLIAFIQIDDAFEDLFGSDDITFVVQFLGLVKFSDEQLL